MLGFGMVVKVPLDTSRSKTGGFFRKYIVVEVIFIVKIRNFYGHSSNDLLIATKI